MAVLKLEERSTYRFSKPFGIAKRYYWVLLDGQIVIARAEQLFDNADAAKSDWASHRAAIDTFVSDIAGGQSAADALKEASILVERTQAADDTYADEIRDVLRRFAGSQST
jgi:hypothetical protein